jgi:hypothetical protein
MGYRPTISIRCKGATLRTILTLLCLVLPLAAQAQSADEPAPAPKPRTFALVSAMGDGFNLVAETISTGSHLPPYQRERFADAGGAMNQLVVRELARQVAALDPASRSVPMVFDVPPMPKVPVSERPQAIFESVVAELKQAPERATWDRILIVTPAYRSFRKDGMAAQLDGMGVFIDPLCESDEISCATGSAPASGPIARRPDGSLAPANSYFAPYFYATVWELDAATLEVIAKREVFHHQKMSSEDPYRPAEIGASELARINVHLATLVNQSMRDALKKTDVSARVEARQVKEVKPE